MSFVLTIPDSVRDHFCFDVLYNVTLLEYNTTFMLFFATIAYDVRPCLAVDVMSNMANMRDSNSVSSTCYKCPTHLDS